MGVDKTQLVLNEETLLTRNVRLLHELGLSSVLVSGPQKHAIADRVPLQGPAYAILNILKHGTIPKHASHMLIIPVDMPLLTDELLNTLIQNVTHSTDSFYFESCPLPAIFSVHALNRIQVDSDANLSIRQLLNEAGAKTVSVPHFSHYQLMNANTPNQWRTCKQTLSKGSNLVSSIA